MPDDTNKPHFVTTDDGEMPEEAYQNLYDQMYDLYLEDKLDELGLEESEMEKAQIVFKAPFKDNQFADGDQGVEVRINDEVEAAGMIKLDTDREIEKGDDIYFSEIESIETIRVADLGDDVGHVTFLKLPNGVMHTSFDFVYNKTYLEPLLDASGEFIETAVYAKENELWRAFIENAFHGAERLMKLEVIRYGEPAHRHSTVQSQFSKFATPGTISQDLYETYNQLKDKYRIPGSYVDPGDYPEGINEKTFELEKSTADEILDVITEYRDGIVLPEDPFSE